jgi:type IV pilus assembly protein PilQ
MILREETMKSLWKISGIVRKATIVLTILSSLIVTAYAQKQNQKQCYSTPGCVGESIDLALVNADVRDVLSFITQQYEVNFVIDKSVKQVPVTVNLKDVPWNLALDSILQSQGLAVQANGPILRVAEANIIVEEAKIEEARRNSQLSRSPLYTEFIKLNYASASGGSDSTSSKSGMSTESSSSSAGGASGGGILGIIKRRLSNRGSIESEPMSNTLVITDVRENIDAIRKLVELLDQPQPQVEIEARIVVADRNFSRDIGVQLSGLVLGSGGAASAGTLAGNGAGNTTGFVQNGAPNPVIMNPNGSLISSLVNSAIGLTTNVFGSAQLSMLITAGENRGQAKTIATPRVTAMNNRKAEISSGSQIPITTPQAGSGGGAIVFTTTYVNVPLRLEVIPQITDAGTVLLDVTAENSTVPPNTSAGVAPPIKTSTMKTFVMVPDGGTTVVGGALLDTEGESQNSTPGLSKIPVLKNLFRRKGISKVSSEILFFITPRIYRPDYNGNPTQSQPSTGMKSTTILQPVPLGNPPSNSQTEPTATPSLPAVPVTEVKKP